MHADVHMLTHGRVYKHACGHAFTHFYRHLCTCVYATASTGVSANMCVAKFYNNAMGSCPLLMMNYYQ